MLEHYLCTCCAGDQKNWKDLLPCAEFCYNHTVHSSYKMTLLYLNFGYYPVINYPTKVMDSKVPAAEKYILKLQRLRKHMRDTLLLAKECMAKYYNKSVTKHEPKFKVGDKVMLNGKNSKTIRLTKKLDHKMHGLFKVKSLVVPYAYELESSAFVGCSYLVYHLSLLEPYHKNHIASRLSPTPPILLELEPNEYEVESIKASQLVKGHVLY